MQWSAHCDDVGQVFTLIGYRVHGRPEHILQLRSVLFLPCPDRQRSWCSFRAAVGEPAILCASAASLLSSKAVKKNRSQVLAI